MKNINEIANNLINEISKLPPDLQVLCYIEMASAASERLLDLTKAARNKMADD